MGKMDRVRRSIATILFITSLGLAMRFATQQYATTACSQIKIEIQSHHGQTFITEKDVLHLLQSTDHIPTVDIQLSQIHSYSIQQQLLKQPFVKSVLVFKTWPNTVHIHVKSKYMICRLLNLAQPNNVPLYVDSDGNILPIAIASAPPLPLLIIDDSLENILQWHDKGQICDRGLITLLHYLYRDPFFCHQITSLQMADNHKLTFGTQIGNHKIEFGKPEHIHSKFEKIRLFYSQVIPYKGWNAYHRINVEFSNQLICE